MGSSLTNYQIRAGSVSGVQKALSALVATRAYISPVKNGWVTVYDEASDSQDAGILCRVAGGLSRALKTDVLAFLVHDSDIAMYWLYQRGELVDEFNSAPDYFGEEVDGATRDQVSGRTEALLPLCVAGTTREQLEAVLHPSDGFPLMAEDILTDLAALLGIDELRIGLGFEYFEQDGEDFLPDADEFQPMGAGAGRKEAKEASAEDKTGAGRVDPFTVAVGMLAQRWSVRQSLASQTRALEAAGADIEAMVKRLQVQFDRSARDMLKHQKIPGRPTFEELKAARDSGPQALAGLVLRTVPELLTEIAIGAIAQGQHEGPAPSGQEPFVDALLEHGLDPKAMSLHGVTPLGLAERHGRSSRIYQLLKAAADQRG